MKRKLYLIGFWLLTLLGLAFPGKASAQAVASFADNELLMGELIRLNIDVPVPSDSAKVDFPVLQQAVKEKKKYFSLLNDTIEIKTDHSRSLDYRDGKYWMRYSLSVQAFDSGRYELPALRFLVNGEQVESNPVLLSVIPVKASAEDNIEPFSDILPPFEVNPLEAEMLAKERRSQAVLWILIGLAILIAIALLVLYIRFLRTGNFLIKKKELTPDAVAIKALKKLKGQKLPQKGKIKEYYTGITDILRTYLHSAFDIKTFEKTSAEIMRQVEEDLSLESYLPILSSIFRTADYVKFAKVNPSEEENERCMEETMDFVVTSWKPLAETAKENSSSKEGGEK